MSAQRRMWRVDDWFRPVRSDGAPRARRVPTAMDRRLSLLGLALAAALLFVLAATTSARILAVIPQGGLLPLGYAMAQVVFLVRTRHLGWR